MKSSDVKNSVLPIKSTFVIRCSRRYSAMRKRLSHILFIAAQIDAVDPVKVRSHEFEDGVVVRFAEHQQIPASGRAGVEDDLAVVLAVDPAVAGVRRAGR